MYRNPSVTATVTDSLVPASTDATTEASSSGCVRTFNSVVAYLLSMTLSFGGRMGLIVSETEVSGLGAILTDGRLLPLLSSWLRAVVSGGEDCGDAGVAVAGAGYAG